jgi:hypothetical protein
MSTFYLLPPRPLLEECLAAYLDPLLPGLRWQGTIGPVLADILAAAVARRPDVYVIHREELPEGESPARALADGFGAEADDEVIEIRPGSKSGEWTARRWRLGNAA